MIKGFRLGLILLLALQGVVVKSQTATVPLRRPDPALERQIETLESTFVKGLPGLKDRYDRLRLRSLPILPPQPDLRCVMDGWYAAFKQGDFPSSFIKGLVPVAHFGIEVYPVVVLEDPVSRYTLFCNAQGKTIAKVAPAPGYDPYSWLEGTSFYETDWSPEELAWQLSLRDPARVKGLFYLLLYNRITDLAAALADEAATAAPSASLEAGAFAMMDYSGGVTSLTIRSVSPGPDGAVLDIAWPEGFTNRLEILASDSLAAPLGWTPLAPVLATEGATSGVWTDRTASASGPARFYLVGNADLDGDSDGLPDVRERRVHGTGEAVADTDGDGLNDGREVLTGVSDARLPDTDDDTLGDGVEVLGLAAWDDRRSAGCSGWREPGAGAVWLTNWLPEQVNAGRVEAGFSPPFEAALVMGAYTAASFQVAVDGYWLLDSARQEGELSEGLNRPFPAAGEARIAPFWDDLRVSASTGMWVEVAGTGAALNVTATWLDAEIEPASGLDEGLDIQCTYMASNGCYTFRYRPASGRTYPVSPTCTAGLQGPASTPLARLAFNASGWLPAGGLTIVLAPALTDPRLSDTDGDLWSDPVEADLGFNPVVAMNPDGDADGDGLSNVIEWERGTDPADPDTDGDGFSDGEEERFGMDPAQFCDPGGDDDQDGLSNWEEWMHNANPLLADTDGDGAGDWLEANQGSDPADATDGGLPPGETMEVVVTLQAGEAPAAPAAAFAEALASAAAGPAEKPDGTVLRIGSVRLRCRPNAGHIEVGRFTLARGKTYEVLLYNMDGQVQARPVWTSISINGLPPVPIPGKPSWICGPAIIENPTAVLGNRDTVVSESRASPALLRALTLHMEGASGEKPPREEWPLDADVGLRAVLSPACAGYYRWTTDVETVRILSEGPEATVRLTAAVTVRATFTPDGASAPLLECTAPLRPEGHTCRWGDLEMTFPEEIPVNDNDSDRNETADSAQNPPPAGDPDLRTAVLSYNGEGLLDCCRQAYAGARVTLSRLRNGQRLRMWNADGSTPFALPYDAPIEEGPWTFLVEGVEPSTEFRDVALQADVTFALKGPLFRIWNTSVLRVAILRPEGSADNFPPRRTRFYDLEEPWQYDWQAVADLNGLGWGLHHPEALVAFPDQYDCSWTLDSACGTLELAHTALPLHFPPAAVTGPYQDGVLRLEARRLGQLTGIADERVVRVYDDHLRRDMANFTPSNLVPFDSRLGTMVGGSRMLGMNSLQSVAHAYNGKREDMGWQSWTCSTSLTFNAPGYVVPPLDIQRGDVIAYYRFSEILHAQTCTGNGNETWGANNTPEVWDGEKDIAYEPGFSVSPAGMMFIQADPLTTFPLTIKVLKKPQ